MLNIKNEIEKEDRMWKKICDHFEGQKPDHDELKIYMTQLNDEYNIDVDIDDDFVESVRDQFLLDF